MYKVHSKMKCLKIEPWNLEGTLEKIEGLFENLDSKLKFKAMLICEEVVTNQIRHANFEDKKEDIEFCYLFQKTHILLLFRDNAKKFNPLLKDLPDVKATLEEAIPGGLGIYIVKKYSNSLRYDYENGYNILRVEL